MTPDGRRLSISTWSLHHLMGQAMFEPEGSGLGRLTPTTTGTPGLPLLEVPALIAAHGIHTLEICHFHFPSVDPAYLAELAAAAARAGVELFSILIDDGDLTHPDAVERERDLALITAWVEVADLLGASHARVVAGQAEADPAGTAEALSIRGLSQLREYGKTRGVEVISENFGRLTRRAAPLVRIAREAGIKVCADFGNFSGVTKYADLDAILPFAASIHAKALATSEGAPDLGEFRRCLHLAKSAKFSGPLSLIHEAPGDPWPALMLLQREVSPYL
jgi:sugar phosphate isomerase/epimerase